jgi:hypothetical protein
MISPNFASGVGEFSTIHGGGSGIGATNKSGLFTISRLNSTNVIGYRNGTEYFNRLVNSTSKPNYTVYIGARNYNVATQYSSNQCAFASIGDGLTDTEAANFYTAVQAFQTALGRSIGTQTVSDADAQAFVTAADIQDQVEANAINNLVIGMKADGLWTKMSAIYPFVGGTSSTHKFNLKNPLDTDAAFRLVFNGGWTHSSTGATPNGTNGYANTFLTPSTSLTVDSHSLSYYSRSNILESNKTVIGSGFNYDPLINISIYNQTNYNGPNFGVSAPSYTETTGLGFFTGTRTAINNAKIYRNGVLKNTSTTNRTTATLPAFPLTIGGFNKNSVLEGYTAKECAFASIGSGLTDTEAANFYTAVQAFQTSLNRNI